MAVLAVPFPWLTVERALWAALLVVATLSRFIGLSDAPLGVAEAERALTGWNLLKNVPPAWWDAPALAFGLWALLFTLGDADLVARLLPAVAGVAIVAVPLWWRPVLGMVPALIAGVLLAVSPSLWISARTAHESTLAVLTLLLLARVGAGDPIPQGRDRLLVPVGLALLLNLGAPGISALLAAGAFYAVRYAVWPTGQRPPLPMAGPWKPPITAFALTHIMVSTGFMHHLAGFGVPSAAAWIAAASLAAGEATIPPLLVLAGMEPLALLTGVPAAVVVTVRWLRQPDSNREAALGLVAVWSLVSLLPVLTDGQASAQALLPTVVGLTLVSAAVLGRVAMALTMVSPRPLLWGGGALLFILAFAYLGLARTATTAGAGLPIIAWLALAAAALLLVRVTLLSPQPRALMTALALGGGGLFSLHATGTAANFGLRPYETRLERTGLDEVYDRAAMQALRESGRNRTLAVSNELDFAYAWALRRVSSVSFGGTPPAEADVVVMSQTVDAPHPNGYRRAVLPLTQRWQQQSGSALDTWRWAVWGRPSADAWQYQRALLFTKDAG